MKKLLLFLLLFLVSAQLALAQTSKGNITNAECITINVDKQSTVGIQVAGTWTGTLQPKISIQGQAAANIQVTPSTSSTAQNTITGNGVFRALVAGGSTFQLCGATVATGTANVFLNASTASAGLSGGGGGGTVTAVTASAPLASSGGTTPNITCPTCATVAGPTTLVKGSDQTGIGETYADVTGMTIAVTSGQTLRFHAYLRGTTNATTTGLLMAINGPTASVTNVSVQMFTGGSTLASGNATTYDSNAPANTGSVVDGMVFLHGLVTFTANGTFALRARAETGSGGTVGIMANSWIEYYLQ